MPDQKQGKEWALAQEVKVLVEEEEEPGEELVVEEVLEEDSLDGFVLLIRT